jgi:hypothetical protein
MALVQDISTVFLYTGFFMEKMHFDGASLRYRINQTLLYLTFPVFRYIYNWWVLSKVWNHADQICSISNLLFGFSLAFFLTIGMLNTLWLFRLFYSVELFRGKEMKRASYTKKTEADIGDPAIPKKETD